MLQMNRICIEAEKDLTFQIKVAEDRPWSNQNNAAIAEAAVTAASKVCCEGQR